MNETDKWLNMVKSQTIWRKIMKEMEEEKEKRRKRKMTEERINELRREIRYYNAELKWRYDELKVLKEKDR